MKSILLLVLLVCVGCSSSITALNIKERHERSDVIRQTLFLTRWSKPFILEQARCSDGRVPVLLYFKSNGNGSKTFVVECKLITTDSTMRLES